MHRAAGGWVLFLAYRGLIIFCYAIYATIGATLTLVGPLIPDMADTFGVGYGAFSPFYLISTACHLITVFSSGILIENWGARRLHFMGLWAASAGCIMMVLASNWSWIIAGFSIFQTGFGFLAVGMNTMVADARSDSRSRALTYLHLFYSIGAVAGPLLSRLATEWSGTWSTSFLAVGVIFGLLGIGLRFFEFPAPQVGTEPHRFGRQDLRALGNPFVLFLGITTVLYVGSEQGISVWMYTYLVDHLNAQAYLGAGLNALFWIGLVVGRLFSGSINERLGNARAILLFVASATGALTVGLFTNTVWLIIASFFFTGLSFSGTFPSLLAFGSQAVPTLTGTINGLLLGAASVGASVFPAWMGRIAEETGIRAALMTAYGTTLALLGATVIVWLLHNNRAPEERNSEIGRFPAN